MIGRAGTGVDNVDVAAATRRGIIVANAPGSNMVAAAEHAFGLLLAIARNIPQAHSALTQGRWERKRFAGVELADKVLGVVGFGRIGQLVATRARGVRDARRRLRPVRLGGAVPRAPGVSASLENLLLQADFVTLHAPLTAETRHLIDAERLHLMKPGVRIVNAARGDLVDLDALAERSRRARRRRRARRVPAGAVHGRRDSRDGQRRRHARIWAHPPRRRRTGPA